MDESFFHMALDKCETPKELIWLEAIYNHFYLE